MLAAAAMAEAARQVLVPAPAARLGPDVRLLGLAETLDGGRLVRTAVLSVDGEVVLAHEGGTLADWYLVVRISGDSVHLQAGDGQNSRVLRLR